MYNISKLLQEQDHHSILQLPSPQFDNYKVIAAINLNKFEEALKFATKNSYELAYIYYKLEQPKKALKILRKISLKEGKSEKTDILISQCLYKMQSYDKAYDLLKNYGNKDEFAVNLNAFYALNSLNSNSSKSSLFTTKKNKKIENPVNYSYSIMECKMEAEYNSLFEKIEDETNYIDELKNIDEKYNVEGSVIKKQIANLQNDDLPSLTKSETKVDIFNKIPTSKFSNPLHFQENFVCKNSEYQILKNIDKFNLKHTKISPKTKKLKILKCLLSILNSPKENSKVLVQKMLEKLEDCEEKQILQLLISESSNETFKEIAIELLK